MKFLADESCDFTVVRALRESGYDVVSIAEVDPRAVDEIVIERAIEEKRILLTEDKDFGQLFFSHGSRSEGVILFRYPAGARKRFSQDVVRLAKLHGLKLKGCFVVVEPGRVRIRRREAGRIVKKNKSQ